MKESLLPPTLSNRARAGLTLQGSTALAFFLLCVLLLSGCGAFGRGVMGGIEGWKQNGSYGASRQCSMCHGTGTNFMLGGPCAKCGGSGTARY